MISTGTFSIRRFLLAKAGSLRNECEDAIGVGIANRRFCVTDGATEGFDSRYWARLLARGWVSSFRPIITTEQFEPWLFDLGCRFKKRWGNKQLSWYAEEKADAGAFAAFIGLSFFDSGDELYWKAIALGDSCLIVRRDNSLLEAFPLSDPNSFGYHPQLIPSNPTMQARAVEKLVCKNGRVELGDAYLLLSDAVAAWYLSAFNSDRATALEFERLLKESQTLTPEESPLAAFIQSQRDEKRMRNDDVAAIAISAGELIP